MELIIGAVGVKVLVGIAGVVIALIGMAWATPEATLLSDAPKQLAISAAVVGGEILALSDGRASVILDIDGVASGEDAGVSITGVFDVKSASATLFTIGDSVYWDTSGSNAIRPEDAVGADFYLGKCTKAKANGDTTVQVDLNATQDPTLQYSNEAASTALTASSTATDFDTNYSFDADDIEVGDVITIKGYVFCSATNSTDTFLLKIQFAGTDLHTTTALDVADGDLITFEATIVIRTIGASGTFVAFGSITENAPGGSMTGWETQSSAIDTTAAVLATAEGKWSTTSASNSARCEAFVVRRDRK